MRKRTQCGYLVLAAFLCAWPSASGFGQSLDLASTKIVDLSHSFDANTIYWPTSPSGFELTQLHKGMTKGGFYYFTNTFCSPEHGGTHLDAPRHFAEGHWTSSDIPPERFIGPAVVIDVSRQDRRKSRLHLDARRYRGLGSRQRPNNRWLHRAVADGVERALAR